MMNHQNMELKLGEFRARHTGKDPFGPWTDLKNLYSSLDSQERTIMEEVLDKKKTDGFWKEFIELFEEDKGV